MVVGHASGGIVGYQDGGDVFSDISNCYNIGNVSATKRGSGGMLGGMWGEGTASKAEIFIGANYNAGVISSGVAGTLGGVFGDCDIVNFSSKFYWFGITRV